MQQKDDLPRAILFDLDDTLIASSETTAPAWPEICEKYASEFQGHSAETVHAEIRKTSRWFWSDTERHRRGRLDLLRARQEILKSTFDRMQMNADGLIHRMVDDHARLRDDKTILYSRVYETLDWFRHQNVRLALVTNGNKEPQREKITRFKLEPYFEYILIEGEFGTGKPDPKVYSHVLAQLDAKPEQAWMVGDNFEWEIVVPKQLGLFTVWVNSRHRELPNSLKIKPDRIVQSVAELVN